jgi:hypothetical protein
VPEERRIRFCIGINLGDVIVEEHDIFGDGVNVAARDARGVSQRYAARCRSSYSIFVAWVNAVVGSDIACKRAGTGLRRPTTDDAMAR